MKKYNIGLFGFGTVGSGFYKALQDYNDPKFSLKKIVVKNMSKIREIDFANLSDDPHTIFNDETINLIVELIDDSDEAYKIVKKALENGIPTISANKKMIARHIVELIEISKKNKVPFLYEAAVCGSLPIIRNLEDYFGSHEITELIGVVNGSTNFILGEMTDKELDYESALALAQNNGFAEADPSLDVEGFDAVNKLSILHLHAFGANILPDSILRKGITSLTVQDFNFAKKNNKIIKLIARITNNQEKNPTTISVIPTFVDQENALAKIQKELNALILHTSLAGEQFFQGKGAGSLPTSAAVLSDVIAVSKNYKYAYKKGICNKIPSHLSSEKFYISTSKLKNLDTSIFDCIDESHENANGKYTIGNINLGKLKNHDVFNDPEISVIQMS